MACPFFYPTQVLDEPSQPRGLVPLGEAQAGECRAGAAPYQPSLDHVVSLCNFGYARGKCPRLPAGSPDAVRFVVRAHSTSAIIIAYACERDHRPAGTGTLEFSPEGECRRPHGDANIDRQALAYLQAYLRACSRNGREPSRPGQMPEQAEGSAAPVEEHGARVGG